VILSSVRLLSVMFAFFAFEAGAGVICADPHHSPPYNVSSTNSNNVPINQCYLNSAGECLYNNHPVGTAGGWNTGCPPQVAGPNCCGWRGGAASGGGAADGCSPPNQLVAAPFQSLLPGNPQDYDRCKKEAASSNNPSRYRCCARVPTPPTGCSPPSIGVPFPFQTLASNPALATDYARCKQAAGSNSSYVCCVKPAESCARSGGSLLNVTVTSASAGCPTGMTLVFGPVQNKVCCKKNR
jgi:hypothetical protein